MFSDSLSKISTFINIFVVVFICTMLGSAGANDIVAPAPLMSMATITIDRPVAPPSVLPLQFDAMEEAVNHSISDEMVFPHLAAERQRPNLSPILPHEAIASTATSLPHMVVPKEQHGSSVLSRVTSAVQRQLVVRKDSLLSPDGLAATLEQNQNRGLDVIVADAGNQLAQSVIDQGLSDVENELIGNDWIQSINLSYSPGFAGRETLIQADAVVALYNSNNQAAMAQIGIQSRDGEGGANVGFIWRHNTSPDLMLGVNSFFDYLSDPQLSRWSVGVEAAYKTIELSANVYNGINEERKGNREYYSPDGWDVELAGRVEQIPWVEFSGRYYDWDIIGGQDLRGSDYKLTLRPIPLVGLSLRYDNPESNIESEFGVEATLQYNFAKPLAEQTRLNNLATENNAWQHRYKRVRREYEQRVQSREVVPAVRVRASSPPCNTATCSMSLAFTSIPEGTSQTQVTATRISNNPVAPGRGSSLLREVGNCTLTVQNQIGNVLSVGTCTFNMNSNTIEMVMSPNSYSFNIDFQDVAGSSVGSTSMESVSVGLLANIYIGSEGTQDATMIKGANTSVTVALAGPAPAGGGLTVNLTRSGTATIGTGNDYTQTGLTVGTDPNYSIIIPGGQRTATFVLQSLPGADDNDVMSFALAASSAANYLISASPANVATVSISGSGGTVQPVASITASNNMIDEEGSTTSTLTVTLSSNAPAGGVTVNLARSGTATIGAGNDYTQTGLTASTDTTYTVTVPETMLSAAFTLRAFDDDDVEEEETAIFNLQPGNGYIPGQPRDVTVTINNNDDTPPTARISATASTITESGTGNSATVTISLSSAAPAGGLTVNLMRSGTATPTDDYAVDTISGTESNYTISIPATLTTASFTLTAEGDDVSTDDANETIIFTIQNGSGYAVATAPYNATTVTIADDDDHGIRAAAENIVEGGTVSYPVTLNTQPDADVVVTISVSDTSVEIGAGPTLVYAATATLTFSNTNWNIPQNVFVRSPVNSITSDTTATLSYTLASTDANYNALSVTPQTVTVTDVGIPPVANFGATPGSSQVTLTWTNPIHANLDHVLISATADGATVAINSGDDLTIDATSNSSHTIANLTNGTSYTFSIVARDADNNQSVAVEVTSTPEAIEASMYANSQGGQSATIRESGETSFTATILLSKLAPVGGMAVNIRLGGSTSPNDYTAKIVGAGLYSGTHPDYILTIPSGTSEFVFSLTAEDDRIDDDDETIIITLQPSSSSDYAVASTGTSEMTVTITDDDTAGATLSVGSLPIAEGDPASYTIALTSQPTADVTVTLTSSDISAVTITSASSIIFTTSNWGEAQTVMLDALEDDNGINESVTISHTASGGDYAGISLAPQQLTVADNDIPGLNSSATGNPVEVTEEAAGTTYTLQLNTRPTADVTVTISSSDASIATVVPASMTFTPSNWSSPQTVTVVGTEDADASDETTSITYSISSGGDYNGVTLAAQPVTITDDDSVGITSSGGTSVNVTENATSTYTLVLDTQPTAPVTINPSSSDTTVVTVSTSLSFSPGNWNVAQRVTVTGVEDADSDSETAQITYVVTGGDYNSFNLAEQSVAVTDNDVPSLTSTGTSGFTVEEGATNSYTLRLNTLPSDTVTVTLSSSDTSIATITPARMTFTTSDWNEVQTVTVTGAEDADASNETTTITYAISGGDYEDVTLVAQPVAITDDDMVGATLNVGSLSINEGGIASYTIVLDTEPTADVTVTLTSSDTNAVTITSASSIIFTTSDWNEVQTVTLSAQEDDNGINESVAISHAVSGGDYEGLSLAPQQLTVTDNDIPRLTSTGTNGFTVEEESTNTYTLRLNTQPSDTVTVALTSSDTSIATVMPDSMTFTTSNWSTTQTVTVTGAADADASDETTSITYGISGGDYNGVVLAAQPVTVDDDDTIGITTTGGPSVNVTENSTSTYTLVLDTEPTATVTVTLSSSDTTAVTASSSLSFSPGNWNTPQTVTVTGVEDADSVSETVQITYVVTGGDYDSFDLEAQSVAVTDNDVPSLTSTGPNGFTVGEGSTNSYMLRLNTQPSDTVTVMSSSSDTSIVTVTPASMTFTTSNWNVAKTLTVTGAEDADARDGEATIAYDISGGDYNEVMLVEQPVAVTDNDTIGIILSFTSLIIDEGGTASYTIVLTSLPTENVTVTLSSSDTTAVTVSGSLSFSSSNWDAPQEVTLTAPEDSDRTNESVTISHTATGGNYTGISPVSLDITVADNDGPGLNSSATGNSVEVTEGDTGTYTLQLNTEPSEDVTVRLSSSDTLVATVSPENMTFTVGNWDTMQTVTVTGVEDTDVTDEATSIAYSISGGDYNGVTLAAQPVAVDDNDSVDVISSTGAASVMVTEGGTSEYTVVLGSQPTAAVSIAISSSDPATVTASPSVNFTTRNWMTPQTISVNSISNSITEDTTATFNYRVTSDDNNYGNLDIVAQQVTVSDVTIPPVTNVESYRVPSDSILLRWDSPGSVRGAKISAVANGDAGDINVDINGYLEGNELVVDRSEALITDLEGRDVEHTFSIVAIDTNGNYSTPEVVTNTPQLVSGMFPPFVRSVSVDKRTITETDGPNNKAYVTITLSKPAPESVSVHLALSGSATEGDRDSYYVADASKYKNIDDTYTVTVPRGKDSISFALMAVDDLIDDDDEKIIVTVLPFNGYTAVAAFPVTITIEDNDAMTQQEARIYRRRADGRTSMYATVTEAADGAKNSFTLTVELNLAPTSPLTINLTDTSSMAILGIDYTVEGLAATNDGYALTVPAGTRIANYSLTAIDDNLVDANERIIFTLEESADYSIVEDRNMLTVTIFDNDGIGLPQASIYINRLYNQAGDITEASGADDSITVIVELSSAAPSAGLEIDLAATGAATLTSDYTVPTVPGLISTDTGYTLTIPEDSTTATFMIEGADDDIDDFFENIKLTIRPSDRYRVAVSPRNAVNIIIVDDDGATPPQARIRAYSTTISETAGSGFDNRVIVAVDLNPPPTVDTTVELRFRGSAGLVYEEYYLSPNYDRNFNYFFDYIVVGLLNDSITVPGGARTASFTLVAIDDEFDDDADEIQISIAAPVLGYETITDEVSIAIQDNDSPPIATITVDRPTITEPVERDPSSSAYEHIATVTIELSAASDKEITVDLDDDQKTARNDRVTDFRYIAGGQFNIYEGSRLNRRLNSVEFRPGTTIATLMIAASYDDVSDSGEYITLMLERGGDVYTIAPQDREVTITIVEGAEVSQLPVASIAASHTTISSAPGSNRTATVTVTLNRAALPGGLALRLMRTGSARSDDFTVTGINRDGRSSSYTLTVPSGRTTASFMLRAGDVSRSRDINFSLRSGTGYRIAESPANLVTVRITDRAVEDSTPPGSVTNLRARAGDAQVTLSWTNPSDADLASVLIVYGAAGTSDHVLVEAEGGTHGSTIIRGLTNGTTYFFGTSTGDDAGNYSTSVLIDTGITPVASSDRTPPDQVTNFMATPGDGQVTLSWTNPSNSDLDSVRIIATTSGREVNNFTIDVRPSSRSTRVIPGLTNGSYSFSIVAVDETGNISTEVRRAATVVSATGTPPPRPVTGPPPTASIYVGSSGTRTASITEASGASNSATVTVSLDKVAQAGGLTVTLLRSGSATIGSDYTASGITRGSSGYTLTVPERMSNATFTLEGIDDNSPDANEMIKFTLISGSGYTVSTDSFAYVTVFIEDNDAAAEVLLDKNSLTISEGGGDSFSMALSIEPTSNVRVNMRISGAGLTVSPRSIIFTRDNWNLNRIVKVNSAGDSINSGYGTTLRYTALSGDARYSESGTVPVRVENVTVPPLTDVGVGAGDGRVTLSWTNPTYPGVYGVIISAVAGGAPVDLNGSATEGNNVIVATIPGARASVTHTVKLLINATEYNFSVVAVTRNDNTSVAESIKSTPCGLRISLLCGLR